MTAQLALPDWARARHADVPDGDHWARAPLKVSMHLTRRTRPSEGVYTNWSIKPRVNRVKNLTQKFGEFVRQLRLEMGLREVEFDMTFFGNFVVLAAVMGSLLGAGGYSAQAQESAYVSGAPSADGIGKRYMGREIARVMGWQGAQWLERQEREEEERTDLLLHALDLKPGMVVADIGAGTGYLSRRMARLVAPSGSVLAVDVQPEMVALLRKAAEAEGVRNITPSLGNENDARLAPGSVDLAIMVDVYHELSSPYEMLRSVVQSLAPGGRVVFVEYKAEDPAVRIKPLHKMTERQIRREAEILPLEWVRTDASLPWQHVVIFRKKS